MGVGSLRKPREYDGRLPPAAGYYLDLVIPRKEEPRKKIGSRVRLLHGRILQIQWSIHMQIYSRISVNVPVKLTRNSPMLVNLLVVLPVKLTKLGLVGGHGGAICVVKLEHGVSETMRPMETRGDLWRPRREIKRLPLYDFRYPPRTFLGELDSMDIRVSLTCNHLGLFARLITSFSISSNGAIATCVCFFFEIPRIEELQDPDSSPRREEVGRRTLRGYGGLLPPFFYPDRFQEFTRHFLVFYREA